MRFGFVVLSHRAPRQLLKLVETLGALYGDPPIACHHDVSQSEIDKSAFPANVRFVAEPVRTGWGKWSLVDASLRALDLLYQFADPDVFFLISAADYPAAAPEKVMEDLSSSPADVWMDAFNLRLAMNGKVETGEPHLAHHRFEANIRLAEARYLRALIKVPLLRLRPPKHSSTLERYPRPGLATVALPFESPLSPFLRGLDCYVGSQWFTGRREVARKLLSPNALELRLQSYLRRRVVPDECYVQTVLCNDPSIRQSATTYRFADWDGGGAHPVELTSEHLPMIISQQPHFIRKVSEDSPLRHEINCHLGLPRTAA